MTSNPEATSLSRPQWRVLLAQAATTALLLAGCGGGGDASGPSTGGTGTMPPASSFAAGTITGFGSVIVNGVRFDDSRATVTDDDGNAASSASLKLGMSAEVHGGKITDDGVSQKAEADAIRFGAALIGPVASSNAGAKSLVVLGQTVLVLDTTVIDTRLAGGFAGIVAGALLEIHATLDAQTGIYTATRIEPTAATAGYKIRGVVSNLDTTAKTFRIGTALISYAGVATVPASLANGLLLKVRLQTTQVAGAWVATRLGDARPRVEDADEAHLKGTITAFASSAAFSVNGIPVDASHATFPNGTTGIVLGANVEVKGTSSNGTIVATRVSTETHEEAHAEGFELHGAITAIDSTAKTFVLRGITVNYAAQTVEFRRGTAATLAVGVQLEVRGLLSADGTTLAATRISFGD